MTMFILILHLVFLQLMNYICGFSINLFVLFDFLCIKNENSYFKFVVLHLKFVSLKKFVYKNGRIESHDLGLLPNQSLYKDLHQFLHFNPPMNNIKPFNPSMDNVSLLEIIIQISLIFKHML